MISQALNTNRERLIHAATRLSLSLLLRDRRATEAGLSELSVSPTPKHDLENGPGFHSRLQA